MVKTMFGVEYYYAKDNHSTYEIFPTLAEAKLFCDKQNLWNDNYYPLYIFKADFNSEHIFQENDLDGQWNYEDVSNTILNYHDFFIEMNK